MGYQPRTKVPRASGRGWKKAQHKKGKYGRLKTRPRTGSKVREKYIPDLEEISDRTLKRLHTLGAQKFGSSPFSQHFDRWLFDLKAVLFEFESNPNVGADEQLINE